jgi:predicted phage baseplate assembly protein
MTRPLGLESVVNQLPSTGGADPQTLDEARQHAPLTVLTLDRIVSLRDFEDFAGAFAGIGKAQASLVWNGQRRVIHLTVGGVGGDPIDASSNLALNLSAAIDAARQTDQPVQIDSYRAVAFRVEARITIALSYLAADVLARAANELVDAFSFSRRAFGESVTKSHILATLQSVEGVVGIDLDALYLVGFPRSLNSLLPAHRAEFGDSRLEPAELLTLAAEDVVLLEA